MRSPVVVIAVGLTLLAVSQSWAQGTGTPVRAARAVIDPFPVTFSRGDSMSARISLVDSVGGDVAGPPWDLQASGTVVRFRLLDSSATSRTYLFSGDAPATETFRVVVHEKFPEGRTEDRSLDSLSVTVADWAIGRLEIVEPAFDAYAGTTLLLRARAFSTHGSVLEDAKVSWETDDPCHARIMPDGAIAFGSASRITVKARAQGKEASRQLRVMANPVQTITLSPRSAQTRAGDVVRFRTGTEDRQGQEVKRVALSYTVTPLDSARGSAHIDDRGYFVADDPGAYLVRVGAGDVSSEALVEVGRRPAASPVHQVGRGSLRGARVGALAVFVGKDGRDYAYTGGDAGRLYTWDVTNAARVVLTDSMVFDSAGVGDIKISPDAAWAVLGRIGGSPAHNGITILDLSTPAHPKTMGSLLDSLQGGVTGLWIYSNWIYVATAGAGLLDIVDASSPAQPRYVGRWETRVGEAKTLYDVSGDEKNLYLAYGADGLAILSVVGDGTPSKPALVAQVKWKGAAAHRVVRAGRLVFVGEQVTGCEACANGAVGGIRMFDVSKMKEPVEIARYDVPEAGVDGIAVSNGTLYAGFGRGGLRIVDVAGDMRGDIYRQGRQAGWFLTAAPEEAALARSVVPFKGYVFVSDGNNGLWVLQHQRTARLTP